MPVDRGTAGCAERCRFPRSSSQIGKRGKRNRSAQPIVPMSTGIALRRSAGASGSRAPDEDAPRCKSAAKRQCPPGLRRPTRRRASKRFHISSFSKGAQPSAPGTSEERFQLSGSPRVGLTALRALVRWVSEHRNEQHCAAEPDGMATPAGRAATEAVSSDRPLGPPADGSRRDSGGGLP